MVPVTRFLPLDISTLPVTSSSSNSSNGSKDSRAQAWDAGIAASDSHFSGQIHSICCNNCHHHVAMAMREMGLQAGYGTQVQCAWQMLTRGQWKSRGSAALTLGPFVVILVIVVLVAVLTR
jgi:hypothetical protein